MKQCSKCNITKELGEFHKKAGGLQSSCKMCKKIYTMKWYSNNKERSKANAKAWQEANEKRMKTNNKAWIQANKERVKNHIKAWDLVHRAKKNATNAKYRSAKLQRTPSWLTSDDWDRIDAFYTEAQRLSKETGIKHEVDHIVPLQGETISGLHHPDNLQILTKSENCSKGNR